MNRHYIICNGKPQFFSSYQAAQDEMEESYFSCTGDILAVPFWASSYSVEHRPNNGIEVRFYRESEVAAMSTAIRKIEVEK